MDSKSVADAGVVAGPGYLERAADLFPPLFPIENI